MKNSVDVGDYIYNENEMIGRGQFGKVYVCTNKKNPSANLCIKIIKTDADAEDSFQLREKDLMQLLMTANKGNQNVVKVEYVKMQVDQILIVMEKCEGDLQFQLDKKKKEGNTFLPLEALGIIKQIINGYKILFCNNIIHRDLKPANILFVNGNYKIADFGLARIMVEKEAKTKVGTPKYLAPQLFFEPTYTMQADVFSLGLMFYELIFGCLPYKCDTVAEIKQALKNIRENPITVELKLGISLEMAELLESMLKYSETDRISWAALFYHPLIQMGQKSHVNQSKLLDIEVEVKQNKLPQKPQQQPVLNEVITPNQPKSGITPFGPPQSNLFTPGSNTLLPTSITPLAIPPNRYQSNTPAKITTFVPSSNPNFPAPFAKAVINFQPRPLPSSPVQQILALPPSKIMSDQLFQIGVLYCCTYELLEIFVAITVPIPKEMMGLKIQLFYLSNCFFEHSKAQNPTNIVINELQKLIPIKQAMEQEISSNRMPFFIPLSAVTPSIEDYSKKLIDFYSQTKKFLPFVSTKKYYLEYLQYMVQSYLGCCLFWRNFMNITLALQLLRASIIVLQIYKGLLILNRISRYFFRKGEKADIA